MEFQQNLFFGITKSWNGCIMGLMKYAQTIWFTKPNHDRTPVTSLGTAGSARKKKAGACSPLAFFYWRRMVNYRWSRKKFSFTLSIEQQTGCKSSKQNIVYYTEVISVLMCVCGISLWFIYNKTKLLFCKMSVFVPYT